MQTPTQKWLSLPQTQPAGHTLYQDSEIPDWLLWYHPDTTWAMTKFHNERSLNNEILHYERTLMFDEASFIKQRIEENDVINVFDLVETSGTSSLPFVYELLADQKMLGTYVAGTLNNSANRTAIQNLQNFVLQARLMDPNEGTFKGETLSRNFIFEDAADIVADINTKNSASKACNLFLLLNSALGNAPDPEVMIKNIYKSMFNGDYLVVLQGIYVAGKESLLVSDYHNIYSNPDSVPVSRSIARIFDPEGNFNVNWNNDWNGVEISITNRTPQNVFGVDLEENQEITLLRSMRFEDGYLKQTFEKIGFRIVSVSYDTGMHNGMYFLKK
jgi:hypothetical protein